MQGGNQKVWNEDLAEGLRARYQQAFQQKKQSQHQWRDGVAAIEAVRKDIKLTSTGKIYNLPNPGKANRLTKTVYETCQRIIRGQEPLHPPGYVALSRAEFETLENRQVDPYLENRCAKRSGAHAILMAFHHGNIEATVTREQICETVRHLNLCDEVMEANYHQGRMYGAWKAKDTLIKHGFLLEYSAGVSYTSRGFRSNGMHTYSITERGKRAIQYLLNKWPDTRACPRPGYGWNNPPRDGLGLRDPSAAMDPVARRVGSAHLILPDEDDVLLLPIKENKQIDDDERDLRTWLATASVGSQKSWKMGKERRKYLHRICDRMMTHIPGLKLQHESLGEQRGRQLFVTVLAKPDGRFVTPSSNHSTSQESLFEPVSPFKRELFPSNGQGKRLGGRSDAVEAGIPARDAAAMAAMSRCGSTTDAKRKRSASQPATPKQLYKSEDVVNLLGDLDSEDYLDRKPAAKRRQTSQEKKEYDFQPGDEVYVTLTDGPSRGPLRIARAHTTGHVTVQETDGRETKVEVKHVHPFISALDDDEAEVVDDSNPCAAAAEILGGTSTNAIDLSSSDRIRTVKSSSTALTGKYESNISASKREVIDLCEPEVTAASKESGKKVTILIDSRERSRNSAPRELRIGLTNQLKCGQLFDIWPAKMVTGEVVESNLSYGDFAFEITSDNGCSRLSVVVERKLIGDLVQRSSMGDHWRQLQRMRDCCNHAIMLIENDTQLAIRFDAYESTGLQPNPSHHLIENDADVFRFIGRAILSSKRIKFFQTRDQQATFRSIGALSLIASQSSKVGRNAPKSHPPASTAQQNLKDCLMSGGIDWQIAHAIAKELGSIVAMEGLLASCETDKAKSMVVFPILANTREISENLESMQRWSAAVAKVFAATHEERASARDRLQKIKETFDDKLPGDLATLLNFIYEEESIDRAVERTLEEIPTSVALPKRVVFIELSVSLSSCFPVGTDDSFYKSSVRTFQEATIARMTTTSGTLTSNALCVYVVEGAMFADMIGTSLNESTRPGDSVSLAKEIADKLQKSCVHEGQSNSDHRVILIRGLLPALLSAAKSPGYRSETKVICDMVLATLMMDHECVVLQAVRKRETELHMILQQLALACYHYQYLTRETTC
ncbi:ERCC4 domain containing protein [Nitzschia inconspicua]|uniref:ERCC4 domain containing protein n=1 Tax=Nitzschia inconspicua TaxID=303405 RepID=A0A9K3PHG3_9STRA|nr:ERCC4 domain containing protein [Nitzschia inconspicua]